MVGAEKGGGWIGEKEFRPIFGGCMPGRGERQRLGDARRKCRWDRRLYGNQESPKLESREGTTASERSSRTKQQVATNAIYAVKNATMSRDFEFEEKRRAEWPHRKL
ncbi:hypothetical protein C8J57DRAFT_1229894 [Mycena rebaudengoi]|nr:hypothetical protein C8J57DRAFT_1229894 [Mycena rebaudengoi]